VGSVTTPADAVEPTPAELSAAKKRLARDVAMFSGARLLLVVVIAGVVLGVSSLLGAPVPLIVALLVALVAQLPLSLVLFNGLRKRVNAGIVVVDARRRAEKDRLHARLSGEPDTDQPR
jgi:hypothetical protein